MLSNAKYGLTVVAPTPIKVAKECVSRASPVWTLIETYPLNPRLVKWVLIAPIHKSIGIGSFSSDILLSVRINCLIPSRTDFSASFLRLFKAYSRLSCLSKVQSKIFELLPK